MTEQSPASERLSSLREQAARLVAEIDQHREEHAALLDDSAPAAEPAPAHGKLWSLLDWSFWGAGLGDVFREPLADTMLAAIPAETIAQAEEIMADFLERRKIEKTGVTIYQEQRDELDQARERIAKLETQLTEMTHLRDNALRALNRDDVDTDPHLPDLFADGLHGLYEWETQPEPDRAPKELVDRCVQIVQPAFGKLTEQRDLARSAAVALEQDCARLEDELAEVKALHNRRLPRVLIKTAKDLDQYVGWSTIAEMPDGIWSRETALEAGIPRTWLERADETGTSALYPEGAWDDEGFIVEQRGWLPRARLGDYAVEWHYGDRVAAYAMLEPLEDEAGEAR